MGLLVSKLWAYIFGLSEFKLCIIGLDGAGKTTTLYKLLLNEVVETTPTLGSNVEEYTHKNVKFIMWDIGGQESLRPSWATYYEASAALIIVIDSTDRARIDLCRAELQRILANDSLANAKLLFFANKQDAKGAMTAAEISDLLDLTAIRTHDWHIQPSCALTGTGLTEGLEWVARKVGEARKK